MTPVDSIESQQKVNQMLTVLAFALIFPGTSGRITISDEKTEPIGFTGIRFSFRVRGDTDQLNGQFIVEHKDCKKDTCGQKIYSPPINDGYKVYIRTELSPCKNHVGIKIKASKFVSEGGGVVFFTREWYAIDGTKTSDNATKKNYGSFVNFPNATSSAPITKSDKSNQDSIIIIVTSLAIVAMIVTAVVFVICKKKLEERRKRGDEMREDENPVYGIYEDGAVYNVVTDGNAYYSSY